MSKSRTKASITGRAGVGRFLVEGGSDTVVDRAAVYRYSMDWGTSVAQTGGTCNGQRATHQAFLRNGESFAVAIAMRRVRIHVVSVIACVPTILVVPREAVRNAQLAVRYVTRCLRSVYRGKMNGAVIC